MSAIDDRHLAWLEEEAIFVLREVAASFERPALLFSGGKDSCVVLRLAEKAFKTRIFAPPDLSLRAKPPERASQLGSGPSLTPATTSKAGCPSLCCTWTPATTSRK